MMDWEQDFDPAIFEGPVHEQIRAVVAELEGMGAEPTADGAEDSGEAWLANLQKQLAELKKGGLLT